MNKNILALGRLKAGVMNKTEEEYSKRLELLKKAEEIILYEFESVTLKIAKDTRYTPDFFVMTKEGFIEMHEVKGFWRDDAKVKIKVAAEKFPFRFIAVKAKAKKDGGGWSIEEF